MFFRTSPGRFFLRAFITDSRIPEKFRTPIVARRRRRELPVRRALAICRYSNCYMALQQQMHSDGKLTLLRESGCLKYIKTSNRHSEDDIIIWSFLIVVKKDKFLTYRHGPFRED